MFSRTWYLWYNNLINKWFMKSSIDFDVFYYISIVISAVIIWFISSFILRFLLSKFKHIVYKSKSDNDDALFEYNVFHNLADIIVGVGIIHLISPALLDKSQWIFKFFIIDIPTAYIVYNCVALVFGVIEVIFKNYRQANNYKLKTVSGFKQISKAVVLIITFLICMLIYYPDADITVIFTVSSALVALISLILKDTLLGIVSCIQLIGGNNLKEGDWIVMDEFDADGIVHDVGLSKVMVENWDKTMAIIPTHTFINQSFVNFNAMEESKGRRIKRSILIKLSSIRILEEDELGNYKKIKMLEKYFDKDSKDYEKIHAIEAGDVSNLTLFRLYIKEYLLAHPKIHNTGFKLMIRHLQPTSKGLPVEIYCFTTETSLVKFEQVQSEVFEHIFVTTQEFDLEFYEEITVNMFS